jgi:hypothetical protein
MPFLSFERLTDHTRIGELSLLKDMGKAMEMQEKAEREEAEEVAQAQESTGTTGSAGATHASTAPEKHVAERMEQLRLTAGSEAEMTAAGMSEKEKSLRKEGKRKGGLTKEQRAELHGRSTIWHTHGTDYSI